MVQHYIGENLERQIGLHDAIGEWTEASTEGSAYEFTQLESYIPTAYCSKRESTSSEPDRRQLEESNRRRTMI